MGRSQNVLRIVACAAFLTLSSLAQNASLIGTVRDPQSGVIKGAAVTLTNTETRVAQNSQTDDEGIFQFSVVRPGDYTVRVSAPGFKAWEQKVVLAVDQRGRVDPVLELGDASTLVTVGAEVSSIQTESVSLGEVIETRKIVEIPLNGRFFLDLALLTAGTVVPSHEQPNLSRGAERHRRLRHQRQRRS